MSGAAPGPGDPGLVALSGVRPDPIDLAEVTDAVGNPAAGAIVTFTGAVRDHDDGRRVVDLAYTAHPSAPRLLAQVAAEVAAADGVIALAVLHRVGRLEIGEPAVVMAVSAAHRGPAFVACARLIDELKARVPIWKEQTYDDGTSRWVSSP